MISLDDAVRRRRCGRRRAQRHRRLLQPEFEVFAIFFRERRNGKRDARQIDALMLAQHSAIDDFADHVFAADADDPQFNQAIGEQDARAGVNSRARSGNVVEIRVAVPGDVLRSDRDLRPGLAGAPGCGAQAGQCGSWGLAGLAGCKWCVPSRLAARRRRWMLLGVIFMCAMGEVQARNVHAEAQQVAHGGFGVAGGADGADDLGAARRRGLCQWRDAAIDSGWLGRQPSPPLIIRGICFGEVACYVSACSISNSGGETLQATSLTG